MMTNDKIGYMHASWLTNNSVDLETCLYVNDTFHGLFDQSFAKTRLELVVHSCDTSQSLPFDDKKL
jgi:hypothetical protein